MQARIAMLLAILLLGSGCATKPPGAATDGDPGLPTDGDNSTTAPTWPKIESATVRPGVRIGFQGGFCTSNFLFFNHSANGTRLFFGVAAHCFGGGSLNDSVSIGGAKQEGWLAYSSWIAQDLDCLPPLGQQRPAGCDMDFALVEVDPSDHGATHPALLHYGGPTSLAKGQDIRPQECVFTYGNTPLRQGIEPTNPREGRITSKAAAGDQFSFVTVTPGVFGDSGSAVLLQDGRAAGILVTLEFFPNAAHNGAVVLEKALEFARTKAGLDVQLATSPVVQAPALPCT